MFYFSAPPFPSSRTRSPRGVTPCSPVRVSSPGKEAPRGGGVAPWPSLQPHDVEDERQERRATERTFPAFRPWILSRHLM